MGNIFDYLEWRGDLSLKNDPLNNADLLILARISNLPFDGILSDSYYDRITIKDAAKTYLDAPEKFKKPLQKEDITLLEHLAESQRFANLKMFAYQNILDDKLQIQFAALIVELESNLHYISYRGTDYSLTGWQEDCNMYYMFPVPSQVRAVEYLEKAAKKLSGKFILGGHSKGGNLAVYSAAFCNESIKSKILDVYNYDGPGFNKKTITQKNFTQIKSRIHTYIPQSSIIGMMFEHCESYTIVKSNQKGFLQHDIFTWEIKQKDFEVLNKMTDGSIFFDRTFTQFIDKMELEERQKVIEVFFNLLKGTEGKTFDEIAHHWRQSTTALLKTIKNTDNKDLSVLTTTLLNFIKCAMNNFSDINPLLKQNQHSKNKRLKQNKNIKNPK